MALKNKTTIHISNLTHIYSGVSHTLFENFTADLSEGWTAVSGENGSGKSTLLKLITGISEVQSGMISKEGSCYYCSQEAVINKDEAEDFFYSVYDKNSEAGRLRGILKIRYDWISNLNVLSEGEKKRLQIACALLKNPDILGVDEPFNHLDENGRHLIMKALQSFRGTGILVSHDRTLSDRICLNCILIEKGTAEFHKGNLSIALENQKLKNTSLKSEYKKINNDLVKLRSESQNRRQTADCSDKRVSKKGISRKDHDAKSKKDLARLSGKDRTGGKLFKQLESRIKLTEKKLSGISVSHDLKTGISITDELCRRDTILKSDEAEIPIGDKILKCPAINICPGDKIAITGNNGSGKTSLIKHLLSVSDIPEYEILFIPQELSDYEKSSIGNQLKYMSSLEKGAVYSNFSRLGSDVSKLIESSSPSPGEWKKLMLSIGIMKNPLILVLDEPVNHMDITSIKCLESALKELNCAMLIVSHDRAFRVSVTDMEWMINEGKRENILKIL